MDEWGQYSICERTLPSLLVFDWNLIEILSLKCNSYYTDFRFSLERIFVWSSSEVMTHFLLHFLLLFSHFCRIICIGWATTNLFIWVIRLFFSVNFAILFRCTENIVKNKSTRKITVFNGSFPKKNWQKNRYDSHFDRSFSTFLFFRKCGMCFWCFAVAFDLIVDFSIVSFFPNLFCKNVFI